MKHISDFATHTKKYISENKLASACMLVSAAMSYSNIGNLPSALRNSYIIGSGATYAISFFSMYLDCEGIIDKNIASGSFLFATLGNYSFLFNHFASVAFAMMPVNLYTKIGASCTFYIINNLIITNAKYLFGTEELLHDNFDSNTAVALLVGTVTGLADAGVRQYCGVNEFSIASNVISSVMAVITDFAVLSLIV